MAQTLVKEEKEKHAFLTEILAWSRSGHSLLKSRVVSLSSNLLKRNS